MTRVIAVPLAGTESDKRMEKVMNKDERDLLEVLKFELNFLEKGGYGRSPREPWRSRYIFEDSPTCMNYDSKDHREPCLECVLFQMVPPEFRGAEIPCRYIPINAEGDTLDSLYRYADQFETEEIFGDWLRRTIAKLEDERRAHRDQPAAAPAPGAEVPAAGPLFYTQNPKCANPACQTAFHWLGGGRFFRFRPDSPAPASSAGGMESPKPTHSVKHYWLCERCAHFFTLAFDENSGVVLKLVQPAFSAGSSGQQLTPAK